jgi:ABC-type polysaccharide/polyol phosphate transport system ATPase subunit
MTSPIAVRIKQVSKKFRRGELHGSLRDFVPNLVSGFVRKGTDALRAEEFWALRDIDLEIEEGEAFGIIGDNGAGKSTLLKLLSRVISPTRGFIQVKGRLSALIEIGAGFHPDLTGRENVYLNGAILGMSRAEITAKLDEIVSFAGIQEFIETPVKRYSSGMYARLGFAVAAHVNPEVLVVDEALSVGDWSFQRKCETRMKSLVSSGATVVFVSHNLGAVSSLCARCALLDRGTLLKIGQTEEVVEAYLNGQMRRQSVPATDIAIEEVKIMRDTGSGSGAHFREGESATVRVTLASRIESRNLAVDLYLKDERTYEIAEIYLNMVAGVALAVEPSSRTVLEFRIHLNLCPGSYDVGCVVRNPDLQVEYDRRFPVASMFISGSRSARGAANLFPQLIKNEIQR